MILVGLPYFYNKSCLIISNTTVILIILKTIRLLNYNTQITLKGMDSAELKILFY